MQGEGSTTEAMSEGEQRAECLEAIETADLSCPGALSFFFQQDDHVAELNVVPADEVRIDLPNGYLLDARDESVLIGEVIVHNDHCLAACLFTSQPGQDVCTGVDAEGNAVCTYVGSSDVESCETLTEACVGG